MLDELKGRMRALRARWGWLDAAVQVQERFGELQGGQLAAAITLAAFLSIFPLILVAVALLGFFSDGRPEITNDILDLLAIPPGGEAAETVGDAIATARESRRTASIVGVAGLLWSGLGLVAALQYAYNSAWQVKGRGIRDKAFGLVWLVGSGLVFLSSFAVTAALRILPGFLAPLQILVGLALGVALFLWASRILPNRDVGMRALLPGALLGAIGFETLKLVGSLVVPQTVARSSALYGSIGVVFAILAWLFFFGRLIVYTAVVNVVLWERRHGTVNVEIAVPNLPGPEDPQATRAGEATRVGVQ